MQSAKTLTDLVRMTEKIGGTNKNNQKAVSFSALDGYDMDAYLEALNSGSMHTLENMDLSLLRLSSYEWCGRGPEERKGEDWVRGLRFSWSNGKSTKKYALGRKQEMEKNEVDML